MEGEPTKNQGVGMVIDISEQKRKGIGYMIEGIIASVTLFYLHLARPPPNHHRTGQLSKTR